MPEKYIIGLNTGSHDAAAALLQDGRIVSLVEQERLSRRKRAFDESPRDAMNACLADGGISLADVGCVAVGWDMARFFALEERPFSMAEFRRRIGVPEEVPVEFYNHHLAHAASGYWTSGWDSACVIVADGRGEDAATTTFLAEAGSFGKLASWDLTESIGRYYSLASAWAGLGPHDVGKFMGLSAYGRATHPMPLRPAPGGYRIGSGTPSAAPSAPRTRLSVRQLTDRVRPSFASVFPYGQGNAKEIMAHADFAAAVQHSVEEAMISLVSATVGATGCSRVILVGGVAMNCSANGMLARSGVCEDLYVPPFAYDCGVAIGAALLAAHERGVPGLAAANAGAGAYLGRDYGAQAAEAAGETAELTGPRLSDRDLADCVSDHLIAGRLVGWFQGRAEVGQRALGARSILADPRRRPMVARLNRVKGREVWRPLAPSVLEEDRGAVFTRDVGDLGRFMLGAAPVREEVRPLMPATVHVDGTARPQFVGRRHTPRYHDVIRAFREKTGTPAVLNTSFNLAGEPVVCSPADAISTFLRSGLDVLVLDDHVLRRR